MRLCGVVPPLEPHGVVWLTVSNPVLGLPRAHNLCSGLVKRSWRGGVTRTLTGTPVPLPPTESEKENL